MNFSPAIDRYTLLTQSTTTIDFQVILRKGVQHATVPLLCDRLTILGHLTTLHSGDVVDDIVVDAIKKFQESVCIAADGRAGSITFKHLNEEIPKRLKALIISKAKWDSIPPSPGKKIVVNIPAFEVWLYENNIHTDTINCIVGRIDRQTTEFSDTVTYADFRPYWRVPESIFKNDKLPKILENDLKYLTDNHFEIIDRKGEIVDPIGLNWVKYKTTSFPYTLRQKPGPWNALGLVKYMFPNRYSIYMHDTPDKSLFNNRIRSFSSGCVRLSNPPKMGSFLLDVPEATVLNNMNDDTRDHYIVNLSTPVPIHITYMTAWIDNNGVEKFAPDIYNKIK